MLLTFITNEPAIASAASLAGIDRIMVDLERIGKAQRQSNRSLFLSDHQIEDIAGVRTAAERSQVMVRVNSLHSGSHMEIERVLQQGADLLMLPYFHSLVEVSEFLEMVDGRAAAVLLVETAGSLAILPELCKVPHIAEIHLGLNDLSISLRRDSHFEVIADGTVARACDTLRSSGIPFGFGGIASLSRRDLPIDPEWMLASQVCEGATRGWLGRTFRDVALSELATEAQLLREVIGRWREAPQLNRDFVQAQLCRQITSQYWPASLMALDTAVSQMETAFAPGSAWPSTRSPR